MLFFTPILLILAQENGLVVPASCWWLFGVFGTLKMANVIMTTVKNTKK